MAAVNPPASVVAHPATPPAPTAEAERSVAAHERRLALVAQAALHDVLAERRSPFIPLLLCVLSLLGWFAASAYEALVQRQSLQQAHQAQQQTVDNAGRLRGSLDALAADTQRLADGGNASAAVLVAELRKRGISISVPAAAAATPAPPAAASR